MTFVESYGPWAVVAGASEGVGAAFAAAVAKEGVNVVLLARRQEVLDEVAASIRNEHGVETRAVAVDLADPSAMDTVANATKDLEVGLLMYCPGADPNYQPFLANTVEVATAMVRRNCTVVVEMCHRFAGPMAARGRGGIIVLSSGAAFVGAPNMVIYGGTKAFDVIFTEALWAELHPQGVDVLSLVLGETDTPALRRLRAERGFVDDADMPLPGVATVDEVVGDALAKLPLGPSWMVSEQLRAGLQRLSGMPRNDAVDLMMKAASATMDHDARVPVTPDDPSPSDPESESVRTSKQDIAEVLVRYATGIDRRDWDLFRTCFTADCQADYGDIGTWDSADAITDFMISAHAELGHTMHRISNIAIDVDLVGDRAVARCYVDGILLAPDGRSGFNPVGWYDDELVRTGDGWRIARRTFTMAHFRTLP